MVTSAVLITPTISRKMVKFNLEISQNLSKAFSSTNSHVTRAYKIHMHGNNFAFRHVGR